MLAQQTGWALARAPSQPMALWLCLTCSSPLGRTEACFLLVGMWGDRELRALFSPWEEAPR